MTRQNDRFDVYLLTSLVPESSGIRVRVSHTRAGQTSAPAALLILLALLVRLATPAGYMLASDGSLAIVPCPGSGALAASVPGEPMAGHGTHMAMSAAGGHQGLADHRHGPGELGTQDCPYAVAAAPVLPPEPPLLSAAQTQIHVELRLSARYSPASLSLAAPPPPSRGPPSAS